MSLLVLSATLLGGYGLLAGVVTPLLCRRLARDRSPAAVSTVVTLAVVGVARSVCLIGGLTAAVLAAGLFVLLQVRATTAPELAATLDALQLWRGRAVGLGVFWGGFLALLLVIALGVHAAKAARRRYEGLMQAVFTRELARIQQQAARDELEDLPPTAEMRQVAGAIGDTQDQLNNLPRNRSIPFGFQEVVATQLREHLRKLQDTLVILDVRRRMDLRLEPDQVELPRPRTRWERVQMFFISRGLFQSLSAGSRAVHALVLVLLVPCLLGLYSPAAVGPIDDRAVAFADLKLDLDNQFVLRRWHEAERRVLDRRHAAETSAAAAEQAAEVKEAEAAKEAAEVVAADRDAAERDFVQARIRVEPPPPGGAAKEEADLVRRQGEAKAARQSAAEAAAKERAEARARAADARAHRHAQDAADLAARQGREAGRDVPRKAAERGANPEGWGESAAADAGRKAAAEVRAAAEARAAEARREAANVTDRLKAEAAGFRDRQKDVTLKAEWHPVEAEVLAARQAAERDAEGRVDRAKRDALAARHKAELDQLDRLSAAETEAREAALAADGKPPAERARAVEDLKRAQAESLRGMTARHAEEAKRLDGDLARAGDDRAARHAREKADLAAAQKAEKELENLRKVADRRATPAQYREAMLTTAPADAGRKADAAAVAVGGDAKTEVERIRAETGDKIADVNRRLLDQRVGEAAARLGPAAGELSAADREVLRDVARLYERASAEGLGVKAPAGGFAARSQAARDLILGQAAAANPGLEAAPTGSRVTDVTLTPEQRAALAVYERAAVPTDLTPDGKAVLQKMEDVARRDRGFVARMKERLASFQEPVGRRALSTRLAVVLAGTIAGGVDPGLAHLLPGADAEVGRKLLGDRAEARGQQFLHDLLTNKPLGPSLDRAASGDPDRPVVRPRDEARLKDQFAAISDRLPAAERAVDELRAARPPTVHDRPEPGLDFGKGGRATEEFARGLAPTRLAAVAEQLGDPLNQYRDLFPGQPGDERRTPRGEMLSRLAEPGGGSGGGGSGGGGGGSRGRGSGGGGGSGGGAGGRGGGSSISSGAMKASSARSRSFGGMRGSARVGGVLIGRDLGEDDPGGKSLDVRGLSWSLDGDAVRLTLTTADGRELKSRPFQRAAVYHALTYAADGRPLAVTMVTASPLSELKILLHPTLVDSPMGYRVVELDRFVDRFTGKESGVGRDKATAEVYDLAALYRLAWAHRLRGLVAGLGGRAGGLDQVGAAAARVLADGGVRKGAARGLKLVGRLADKSASPLTAKPEYFDPDLVRMVRDAGSKTDLAGFGEAVEEAAGAELLGLGRFGAEARLQKLARRWLAPPPSFTVWSGVREAEFRATPDDLLVADGKAVPMPFRFMVQVAFESRPMFLPGAADADDAQPLEYTDRTPWEFPAIADAVHDRVVVAVAKDPTARAILADAAEFAVLQRLFRAGLGGRLGAEFPVERLVELAAAVAPPKGRPAFRTPRWNARGVEGLLLQVQLSALALRPPAGDGADARLLAAGVEAVKGYAARGQKFVGELDALQKERDAGPVPEAWAGRWAAAWAGWVKYQDEWLAAWDKAVGTENLARAARGGGNPLAGGADDSEEAVGGGGSKAVAEKLAVLAHQIRMRHHLGVVNDDRQMREDGGARPLPPLR